jgi:hypothetical protein
MKHVVRKLFVDFEKEEKWLNEMAAKGLNFIDYSIGRYLFEEGKPGEYIYRLELLKEIPNHAESQAYIKFMEEAGVECVDTYMRWVYFRKKAEDGAFDLYSDYASRIKQYERVAWFVGTLWFLNLIAAIYNVSIGLTIGRQQGFYVNIYLSLVSWAVVVPFGSMIISYIKKIRKMKREKQLYE